MPGRTKIPSLPASRGALLTTACALLLTACQREDPNRAPMPELKQPVGVKAIRERGVLRLLTRNNGNCYFVLRGRRQGFDYELGERLARQLGVKLEVIVPANWGDLIPMLQVGDGDIIAAGMNITPERQRLVAFANPYALTHIRVVWKKGTQPVENAEELSGKVVHVRRRSAYFDLLAELNELFASAGLDKIEIVIEAESRETEQILADVAKGEIPYSLCDHHMCLESQAYNQKLVVGPPVSNPAGLAWAVHPDAEDLRLLIDDFFARERRGDLAQVYRRYYATPKKHAKRKRDAHYVDATGRVSPFDDLFRDVAKRYSIDWRLLASHAYHESRYDPKAETPGGGHGLFGMLPATGRERGAVNLYDPRQATEAAAAQIADIRTRYIQVPVDTDQLKFALAAYQAGHDHITDARVLAAQQKLDANSFADVARVLPLLSLSEYSSKARHGFVKGAETVAYVEEIWERFRAYKHALGERDASDAP